MKDKKGKMDKKGKKLKSESAENGNADDEGGRTRSTSPQPIIGLYLCFLFFGTATLSSFICLFLTLVWV